MLWDGLAVPEKETDVTQRPSRFPPFLFRAPGAKWSRRSRRIACMRDRQLTGSLAVEI
jgi:hypothetical protein